VSRLKIFNYHNVAAVPSGARMPKLYVTPAQFEKQCRLLQMLGLRGVSLSEGLRAQERGDAHRCVALTFDDGYADNLIEAAPILRQFGFTATCYIVAGCIGTHNAWDAVQLATEKPLMNREQIKSWLNERHEIGSHTVSHPHLHSLSRHAAEEEILASKSALERLSGAAIEHFCYPYGEYNDETLQIVRSAGYKSAVTTQRGVASIESDRMRLPRISINGDKGMLKFVLKAATPYAGLSWRRAA
jgi:peptidoglycan/xylan/chitin deacetylase (PgdA/CDA1 family)